MVTSVKSGRSDETDPARAVHQIAEQIGAGPLDALIFFCSPDFDLDALGREIDRTFKCPIVGCTSSGHIGPAGFEARGIFALGLSGGTVRAHPFLIDRLDQRDAQIAQIAEEVGRICEAGREMNHFGLLFVDGLSMCEERLTADLYQRVGNIPILGGSAGDNLRFERTSVYAGDGRFLSNAAQFVLFETAAPVQTFMVQHFKPGETELVITAADPERRIIFEMNGEPAAIAYAEATGVPLDQLTPGVFSLHPLVLSLGDESYVRSIQKANSDHSLTCYCAIEEGLVVSIGHALDPVQQMTEALSRLHEDIPEPSLILGLDCILLRLQFERAGTDREVGAFMARNRIFGFCTYGEQFNGVHMNQTLTAVAIGGAA